MRLGRRPRQPPPQRGRRRGRLDVDGERAAHAIGHGLERQQRVLGLDRHRLRGDLGRDRGIAVPVAADPAPEPEERRGAIAKRGVEGAKNLGRHAEQRLVEDRHERPHLVERTHVRGAHLGRPPEGVDLFAETPFGVGALRVRRPRVVQPLELVAHAPDGGHDRAPARLGRVGREDRVHLEARGQRGQAFASETGPQRADGRRD